MSVLLPSSGVRPIEPRASLLGRPVMPCATSRFKSVSTTPGLTVVGTVSFGPFWAQLSEYLEDRGLFQTAESSEACSKSKICSSYMAERWCQMKLRTNGGDDLARLRRLCQFVCKLSKG